MDRISEESEERQGGSSTLPFLCGLPLSLPGEAARHRGYLRDAQNEGGIAPTLFCFLAVLIIRLQQCALGRASNHVTLD